MSEKDIQGGSFRQPELVSGSHNDLLKTMMGF
jgi:hypothetical protein